MSQLFDLEFYNHIKEILTTARNRVYHTANSAMVRAYWEIGKSIVEKQGGEQRAEYGSQLIKGLSKQMTADFGKGIYCYKFKVYEEVLSDFPKKSRAA